MLIAIRQKIVVPEQDIQDAIEIVKQWFEKNPEKDICCPAIFGHEIWEIKKNAIEEDVKSAAEQVYPYNKGKE